MKYDILFLHATQINPAGISFQGPPFPLGIMGLASLLDDLKYRLQIINIPLERKLNKDFEPADFVKNHPASLIFIDLHWFVHSNDASQIAGLYKSHYTEIKILLGGLTTSVYDLGILSHFPYIDAIIRGDSEEPLIQYVSAAFNKSKPDFKHIANLTYRDKTGKIFRNGMDFQITPATLNRIDYGRLDLIANKENNFLFLAEKEPAGLPDSSESPRSLKTWAIYTGRGCTNRNNFFNDPFIAYRCTFQRNLALRSPEKIAEDIMHLNQMGIDRLYIPHSPFITPSPFHLAILEQLEKRVQKKPQSLPLETGFLFEEIPHRTDPDVFERYLQVFNPQKSLINLYLTTVDEKTIPGPAVSFSIPRLVEFINELKNQVAINIKAIVGLANQSRASTFKLAHILAHFKKSEIPIRICYPDFYPDSIPHPGEVSKPAPSPFFDLLSGKKSHYRLRNQNDISLSHQMITLSNSMLTVSNPTITVEEQISILKKNL
jgi:hypothetical protein